MALHLSALSSADLLALWESTVPEELTDELGEDWQIQVFEALCAVGALVSSAFLQKLAGLYVSEATAGAPGVGYVIWNWDLPMWGSTFVRTGSVFVTASGIRVVTTSDSELVLGNTAQWAEARALFDGVSGNLDRFEALEVEEATWTAGAPDLDLIAFVAWAIPPDATFLGGSDAQLEALGDERGLERQDGEAEDLYRLRVQELPDTVSPAGLLRTARRIWRDATGKVSPIVVLEEHFDAGVVGDLDPADEETGPDARKGNPPGYLLPLGSGDGRVWMTLYVEALAEVPDGLVADVGPADLLPVDVGALAAERAYQLLYSAIQAAKAGGAGFYLARREDWPGDAYGEDGGVYGYGEPYSPYAYPEED